MELNHQKCELYTKMEPERLGDLQRVPRVLDTTEWSYLGAPLGGGRNSKTGLSALERAGAVTAAIQKFVEKFPLQAFSLLRYTVGACRIQHLCQAIGAEELWIDLQKNGPKQHCQAELAVLASEIPRSAPMLHAWLC